MKHRLVLLVIGGLFIAAQSRAASEEQWKQALGKARQEGKVVVGIPLGEAYRQVLAAFQKSFPEIRAEVSSIHTRDFIVRIQQERRVGQFLWDVFIGGPDVDVYRLGREGA